MSLVFSLKLARLFSWPKREPPVTLHGLILHENLWHRMFTKGPMGYETCTCHWLMIPSDPTEKLLAKQYAVNIHKSGVGVVFKVCWLSLSPCVGAQRLWELVFERLCNWINRQQNVFCRISWHQCYHSKKSTLAPPTGWLLLDRLNQSLEGCWGL